MAEEAATAALKELSSKPSDPAEAADVPSATDAPEVLSVEDNADVRALLRSNLEKEYHLLEAADGQAGLEAARQHRPALVISDIMMPSLDGFELCRRLRADEALGHIPVVLLTARVAEEDLLRGFGCGADDYLAKPFVLRRNGTLAESPLPPGLPGVPALEPADLLWDDTGEENCSEKNIFETFYSPLGFLPECDAERRPRT